MDQLTKDVWDLSLKSVQAAVVIIAGLWAYYRFRREAPLEYRVEFDLDCDLLGSQKGSTVAMFAVSIHNRGNVEHRCTRLALRVRGIKTGSGLTVREDKRLLFPVELFKADLVPADFEYYFVRPGIRQSITFTAMIPEDISFILARVSFKYVGNDDLHTAEKSFRVPVSELNDPVDAGPSSYPALT
jgi:hypothetical protein